ncbi:SIR2 family protein [Bradyrhizobium sp. CB1650]|uniref:SIR2 family protein n=1 Tax=Bradyrhizobium sp. CB1650 TaxID=3039153 RepID=UPI002435C8B5|nr:SIR2 family protein [Bradyrhizobium sp. CB1650]WGD53002.1 SIR2 family protein [Bradyrhizobium sp. CB1650]
MIIKKDGMLWLTKNRRAPRIAYSDPISTTAREHLRFLPDGPSIPDDLLIARDQGRVVFFCGAGVSRARANLADFLGLTRAVADRLAIAPDSTIRELIAAFPTLPTIKGLGSLVSADRVFSLMEREFATKDIYNAIAASLRPTANVDLSAHRCLLDLARGPSGQIRLVTTNFDLLFEASDPSLQKWKPPRLPDPLRSDEFEGIVHLHGYVTDDYVDATGDGLVISSAEFGRAYLSERWATDFIRAVLEKYVVVFIGYAADDPPMQYLLEGLSRRAGNSTETYAFHAGSLEEGQARWTQKGVRVVSYPDSRDHAALWSTLEAWAGRARDPDGWYEQTIALARGGPERLLPHERGQVAHIVSTLEGAKRFGSADPAPSATWLCCFDPLIRYAKPGRTGTILERGNYFDPFDAYGLDSDAVPVRINPDDSFAKREVPQGAWSCFALTRKDQEDAREDAFSGFRGYYAVNSPGLTARLSWLGNWLVRVSNQPASVWWAAKQDGIHSSLQQQIRHEHAPDEKQQIVRLAWRYLFESWRNIQNDFYQEWFSLLDAAKREGWTEGVTRRFVDLHTPYINASQAFSGSPRPPDDSDGVTIDELVHLDVEYPHSNEPIVIPDDKSRYVLRGLCRKLELGVALEVEIGGYALYNFDSIGVPKEGDAPSRQGISALVYQITSLFSRLAKHDAAAAKREARNWKSDDPVFLRLLIWAHGDDRIFSAAEAGSFFLGLSSLDFWDGGHQADLLLSLSRRWDGLARSRRRNIERRLLKGRSRWKNESKDDFVQNRSSLTLTRISWLQAKGCKFEAGLDAELVKLKTLAPQWTEEYISAGVRPAGMQVGWVRTDTSSTELQDGIPLGMVLERAAELTERRATFFVERDPFVGLVATKPVRALSAITAAEKQGRYYPWAWRSFLNFERRSHDPLRLITLIATRLSRLPLTELVGIVRPVCSWMQTVSKVLLPGNRSAFHVLWCRVLGALEESDEAGRSGLVRSTDRARDWATEALNSPAGSLSQAILNDPDLDAKKLSGRLPAWWVNRAEELLELKGDPHLHSITLFSHHLVWFFHVDPAWTKIHLLTALEAGGDDASAFWAGLFWAGKLPQQDLYLGLKSAMLKLAKNQGSIDRREHAQQLAAMLLAGWGGKLSNGERAVTDSEMRSVLLGADDDLRSQIIWCLERWSTEEESSWADDTLVLLDTVWPRQLVARTARVSSRLCSLAFSQNEKFPQFVDRIVPLVTTVEQNQMHLPIFKPSEISVFDRYPDKVLKLLSAVLPDDARKWPYGMGDVLSRVEKADPAFRKDSRWIELKRIWDSR